MTLSNPPGSGGSASASPLQRQLDEAEQKKQNGDLDGALAILDRVLQGHPKSARALNDRGSCLRIMGEPARGAMDLRKARKIAPDSPHVLGNLAQCLRDQGELDTAIKAFRKAIELNPNIAPLYGDLGATYQAKGDAKRALAAYEKSIALDARNPTILANVGSASLEVGDIERALEMSDRALQHSPQDRRALVTKAFALHELGREEEAAYLFNLDFVRPFGREEVAGFESVAAFNEALTKHVRQHPTLEYEPANRSTTKGEQTDELLVEPMGPMAELERIIRRSVEEFLDGLPEDSAHPYLSHRPAEFRLNVWGTCLGSAGHQSPHIHPGGWVSGVYYAQIPGEVASAGEDREGWIQFGGAPDACILERARPMRHIQPQEGVLVLFPSYFYHRTLPFHSESKRISIAFDAIPIA